MLSTARIRIALLSVPLVLGIAFVSAILLLKEDADPAGKGCETLERLKAEITTAFAEKNGTGLFKLSYLKGSPNELREAMKDMSIAVTAPKKVQLKAVTVHKYEDYEPDMQLPGEYEDKPLEWVFPPSHWIVVQMETPAAERRSSYTTLKIELPVGQEGGRWYVVGIRYKQ